MLSRSHCLGANKNNLQQLQHSCQIKQVRRCHLGVQPNATTDNICPNPLAELQVKTLARLETGLEGFCTEEDRSRAANWMLGQKLGTSVPAPFQLSGRLAINPKRRRLGKQTQEKSAIHTFGAIELASFHSSLHRIFKQRRWY